MAKFTGTYFKDDPYSIPVGARTDGKVANFFVFLVIFSHFFAQL